jgi:hypothetical protein
LVVLEEQTLVWAYLDLRQSLDLAFLAFFVVVEPFDHLQVPLDLLELSCV